MILHLILRLYPLGSPDATPSEMESMAMPAQHAQRPRFNPQHYIKSTMVGQVWNGSNREGEAEENKLRVILRYLMSLKPA